jgi:molecular chaperone GrpE (heat shock protein)
MSQGKNKPTKTQPGRELKMQEQTNTPAKKSTSAKPKAKAKANIAPPVADIDPGCREVVNLSGRIFRQQCEQLIATRLGNKESQVTLSEAIFDLREQFKPLNPKEILTDKEYYFLKRQIQDEDCTEEERATDEPTTKNEENISAQVEQDEARDMTLTEVSERTEKIEKILSQYVADSQKSEKIIDHLEDEVRRFKTREDEKKRSAMILEIVMIKDRIDEVANHFTLDGSSNQEFEELYKAVEVINDSMADVLLRQGVTLLNPDVGSRYDSSSQQVENVLESKLAEDDLEIVRVTRAGYMLADKVIRPTSVNIKKFIAVSAD